MLVVELEAVSALDSEKFFVVEDVHVSLLIIVVDHDGIGKPLEPDGELFVETPLLALEFTGGQVLLIGVRLVIEYEEERLLVEIWDGGLFDHTVAWEDAVAVWVNLEFLWSVGDVVLVRVDYRLVGFVVEASTEVIHEAFAFLLEVVVQYRLEVENLVVALDDEVSYGPTYGLILGFARTTVLTLGNIDRLVRLFEAFKVQGLVDFVEALADDQSPWAL